MFAPCMGCELRYPMNRAATIYPDREAHDPYINVTPTISPVPSAIPKEVPIRLTGD